MLVKKYFRILTFLGKFSEIFSNVLDIFYQFANEENHKYELQYERALILRQMYFKLLNSYFPILYVAFIQDSLENIFTVYNECNITDENMNDYSIKQCMGLNKFKNLFIMLLPIIIVKQLNYMLLNLGLPLYLYKRKEKKYFVNVDELFRI